MHTLAKGTTAVGIATRSLGREEARQGSHCVSVLSLNPREVTAGTRGEVQQNSPEGVEGTPPSH